MRFVRFNELIGCLGWWISFELMRASERVSEWVKLVVLWAEAGERNWNEGECARDVVMWDGWIICSSLFFSFNFLFITRRTGAWNGSHPSLYVNCLPLRVLVIRYVRSGGEDGHSERDEVMIFERKSKWEMLCHWDIRFCSVLSMEIHYHLNTEAISERSDACEKAGSLSNLRKWALFQKKVDCMDE